jgi:hypothetical protein
MKPQQLGRGLHGLLRLLRPLLEAGSSPGYSDIKDDAGVAILAAARRQRVIPQLAAVLSTLPRDAVPQGFRASVEQAAEANARSCLANLAEHIRIHETLTKAGIPSIPLKGVALSQQLHGSYAARAAGDIDVWIDPEQFDAADAALLANGFRPAMSGVRLTPTRRRYMLRLSHSWNYITPVGRYLELHWRLHDVEALFPITFRSVLASGETVRMGQHLCPAFPRDALYPYVLTHGARSCWARLAWVLDAFHMAQPDPACAREWAATFGTERMHDNLLDIVQTLADAAATTTPGTVRSVGSSLRDVLDDSPVAPFARGARGYWERLLYLWRLRTDSAYRRNFIDVQLLKPRLPEVMTLPDWLIPFAILLRPYTYFARARLVERMRQQP